MRHVIGGVQEAVAAAAGEDFTQFDALQIFLNNRVEACAAYRVVDWNYWIGYRIEHASILGLPFGRDLMQCVAPCVFNVGELLLQVFFILRAAV